MKLQELLIKHKNKSIFNNMNMKLCNTDGDKHRFHIALEGGARGYVSISDLLFPTPFLSLLEWRKGGSLWAERDNINGLSMKTLFGGSSDYHKINLVLLNTDEERIEYIEANTI